MKTYKKIFLLLLVIGSVTTSCKKDTEETPEPPAPINPYYIEFGGSRVDVDTCYDIYYEDMWNSYYHSYLLVPRTITYNTFFKSLSGKADGFLMRFERDNTNLIKAGEYILDSTSTAPAPGEIWHAHYCINYDYSSKTGKRVSMKSGKCKITATGASNEFEIEGTFLGEDKKEYKIYYKGVVTSHSSNTPL